MQTQIENIPAELKSIPNWVCWQGQNKIPKNPFNGRNAQSNNRKTWGTFEQAVKACDTFGLDGLGFMFDESLDYFGVDLDHCIDNVDFVDEFVETLESYAEISKSGTGIHIICKGKLPEGANRKNNVEMYSNGRYFIVTGNIYNQKYKEIKDCTETIKVLHNKYLPKETPKAEIRQTVTVELDDSEVIEKARNCKTGTLFSMLYSGQWEGLFPSQSEADLAFCNQLAFWCGKNESQMDRIFRNSGLMRDKWDKKRGSETYGNITIEKACASCNEVYEPKKNGDTSLAMKFFKSPSPVEPVATEEHRADVETKLPPQTRKQPIICNSAATLNLDVDSQPKFYIPQILGQGVTFLNAPPKCGKSRLFMQMALALCEGGYFMGRKCEKVGVLYLALEDEKCDFKPRLDAFLQGNNAPTNLYCATSEDFNYTPPTLENDELIQLIESNLQAHSDIGVVLIDVFGAIRSKRKKGEDFMDTERRDIQSLIKLAAKNRIALAVSHHVSHTKKSKDLETIGSGAGSYVVAATVHAEMLLYKNEDTNSYTFSVQGRRMPLQKFAVIDDFPKWRFSGTAEEFEIANNPLIITIKHIVDTSPKGKWTGLASEIVEHNKDNALPPIVERINKATFSKKLINQLSTISIRCRQLKNGSGGTKYQFERI